MPSLFPPRRTLVLPEHLNDLRHEIHTQYGQIEAVKDAGHFKRVVWHQGHDPHLPRQGATSEEKESK